MTAQDLIRKDDDDIVFEGEKIQDFADFVESLAPLFRPDAATGSVIPINTRELRTAIRIVGRRGSVDTTHPGTLGYALGRTWEYYYAGDAMEGRA